METVIIVIHLMVVLALVGVVLLQRSEGGGLGIGGGSGFMTARGAANALTRATAILAVAFFATSLTLSIMARYQERATDILDNVPASTSGETGGAGVLDQLGGSSDIPSAPATPSSADAPASATPPADAPAATTPPADVPATPPATTPATPPAAAAPATPPADAAPAEPGGPVAPAQPAVPN